jgi:hypothetical protein
VVLIAGHEALSHRVVPAGAQIVEAEIGVVPFASVEIGILRGAGVGNLVAKGVALVGAALNCPVFACTPDQFPNLMTTALARHDINQWAAAQDIALVRGN